MALNIIYLICVILVFIAAEAFAAFVISKLRKIDSQTDSIPKRHWSMSVYMDDIPQTEQNTLHLNSVPLKIYERGKYSDLPVPHVDEEVGGVYYSGQHKFNIEGIVANVYYNTDLDLIVVSCKCTKIRKI